ncbi:hypothetical protein GCM10029992_10760 [Glycomyces albus]
MSAAAGGAFGGGFEGGGDLLVGAGRGGGQVEDAAAVLGFYGGGERLVGFDAAVGGAPW